MGAVRGVGMGVDLACGRGVAVVAFVGAGRSAGIAGVEIARSGVDVGGIGVPVGRVGVGVVRRGVSVAVGVGAGEGLGVATSAAATPAFALEFCVPQSSPSDFASFALAIVGGTLPRASARYDVAPATSTTSTL